MATKLYKTSEAAAAVGVSRQTLQAWIVEQKIRAPKLIGQTRVWTQEDVVALRKLKREIYRKGRRQREKANRN